MPLLISLPTHFLYIEIILCFLIPFIKRAILCYLLSYWDYKKRVLLCSYHYWGNYYFTFKKLIYLK